MGRIGAGGFTLVEILLGVAAGAIGLAATMAIPAYKDHGVRAQVNDLVIAFMPVMGSSLPGVAR